PLMYDISMGVRREDSALRGDVNSALARHKAEIDAVLAQYGVPRLDMAGRPAR
ncbi:quinoprotein dehydrogenase-associated putative ABC transporter substrate-binding protein, partial [Mesorhizobium sp. M7A.F.Ca.US.001.02.1.1]